VGSEEAVGLLHYVSREEGIRAQSYGDSDKNDEGGWTTTLSPKRRVFFLYTYTLFHGIVALDAPKKVL